MLTAKCISNQILTHLPVYVFHWCVYEVLSYKALHSKIGFPKAVTGQVQTARGIPWQDSPGSISQICHLHVWEGIWLHLPLEEGKGFQAFW